MKTLKRMIALALTVLLAACAAGCHPQGEIAVTVGDTEFTSAYYMCALVFADTDARTKVEEALGDEADTDIDYYSQKVEDTDYVEWVKNTALESLKMIAAYKARCAENDLTIDEETKTNAEQYAAFYWSSYGYSAVFEPNGVSESTYTQYMVDSYYSSLYFEHLYAEGGTEEIAAADVSAKTLEKFQLVDMLQTSFSSMEEDEITAERERFNGYVTSLQGGASFEEIYREYNDVTDDDTTADADADSEELTPVNKYASILGAEDTDYKSDYYDDAVAMAVGEVKLVELDDDAGLVLLVKRDLSADAYYMDRLDLDVRHIIKDDDYTADMEAYAGTLDTQVNNYAVNRFKVKKIKYPSA